MNMSLIIMEGKYGAIGADNSSCHGYYIIKFSSSLYILQTDLRIGGQVILLVKLYARGFFPININYH